jgi:hypothetical protein
VWPDYAAGESSDRRREDDPPEAALAHARQHASDEQIGRAQVDGERFVEERRVDVLAASACPIPPLAPVISATRPSTAFSAAIDRSPWARGRAARAAGL